MTSELLAGDRLALLLADSGLRVRALHDATRIAVSAPFGAQAFPEPSSGGLSTSRQAAAHRSRMICSGSASVPSCTRMRPPSAVSAASSPTSSSVAGRALSSARRPPMRTRSIAPESRDVQLAFRHHGDEEVQRLLRDAVDLLHVEQRAPPQRIDQRPVDEDRRVVPMADDLRGVEASGETGRRQLGVALDEHEVEPVRARDGAQHRRLSGARRSFEQHVSSRVEGGDDQLDFAGATDDRRTQLADGCRRLRQVLS